MPPSTGTKPGVPEPDFVIEAVLPVDNTVLSVVEEVVVGGACGPNESGLPSIVVTNPVPAPPPPLTKDAGDVAAAVDEEGIANTPAEVISLPPLPLPPPMVTGVVTRAWQAPSPTLLPPPILIYPLLPTILRTKLLPWMYCPKFVARPKSSTASGPENSAHL
ncbi:hypothetical protein PG995_005807 [Apiospora arundinis]